VSDGCLNAIMFYCHLYVAECSPPSCLLLFLVTLRLRSLGCSFFFLPCHCCSQSFLGGFFSSVAVIYSFDSHFLGLSLLRSRWHYFNDLFLLPQTSMRLQLTFGRVCSCLAPSVRGERQKVSIPESKLLLLPSRWSALQSLFFFWMFKIQPWLIFWRAVPTILAGREH